MKNEEIIKQFIRIKNMGYIKESKRGATALVTFNSLIGDTKITFIAKDICNNERIKLFKYNLEGKSKNELERIRNIYGYYLNNEKNAKIIKEKISANCSTNVGGRFLFKTVIDYDQEKIFLNIMDRNYNIIESKSYWIFKNIMKKLLTKYSFVGVIGIWKKKEKEINYFKYYDIELYQLKPLKEILKLIENGTISFNLNIESKIKEINFEIERIDFIKLFDKI